LLLSLEIKGLSQGGPQLSTLFRKPARRIERIRVGWTSTGGYNTAEDGIWANADVYAQAQACGAGQDRLAEWLNDIELLPELLADESDRTGIFIEMLHSIARVQPSCQSIVAEFDRVSTGSA
jgi:hypothetical protein